MYDTVCLGEQAMVILVSLRSSMYIGSRDWHWNGWSLTGKMDLVAAAAQLYCHACILRFGNLDPCSFGQIRDMHDQGAYLCCFRLR